MLRYEEDSSYVNVCIYIKITWPNGEEPMYIISFHEDEEWTDKADCKVKLNKIIVI